ncbi:hypothetical protein ACFO4O_15110 [Glaciecola siphonariae]|uniref:DUF8139 domain-containing protein n=1 Tax=Glaciecola siphonariae TaxID=521012 RepID=A0ABV9M1C0_9ALTE
MAKFNINDTVLVKESVETNAYVGQKGSIINVFETRPSGKYFEKFPAGVIYMIEFENGDALDVHESELKEI